MHRDLKVNCSIVIPVYNGAETIPLLIGHLNQVLPGVAKKYEVICVNDGSLDQSWDKIVELAVQYSWVSGVNLARNYGQHNALLCGIRKAQYPITVTMDDDLQHPPEEIQYLLNKLAEGYDVVYGVPKRQPHSFWRNIFSKSTKYVLAKAMRINNIRDISAFRAFKTDLRDAFAEYKNPNLILDVLLSWSTTCFTAVNVNHQPRLIGNSEYTFVKLVKQAMLLLIGFSTVPLRLASWVGLVFTLFGFGILIYVLGNYFIEGSVLGFTFLASIVTLFSGAQLFSLGIFGEYLTHIFERSMGKPTYVISASTHPSRFEGKSK